MSFSQTGISFPFRVGVRGGIVMSTTAVEEVTHIEESVLQILKTSKFERTMEAHMYSSIDAYVFENLTEDIKALLKYQVCEALKLETRIKVGMDGIDIIDDTEETGKVTVSVTYTVIAYETDYTTSVVL